MSETAPPISPPLAADGAEGRAGDAVSRSSISSPSKPTSSAGFRPRTAGSASMAARFWVRRWWRHSARSKAASATRCMPIFCGPAIRARPFSTRSTAAATAAASPRGAWWRSRTARPCSPWRRRFRWRKQGLEHQFEMPEAPDPDTLPSERQLRMELASRPAGRSPRLAVARPARSKSARSIPGTASCAANHPPRQMVWFRAVGDASRRRRAQPVRAGLRLRHDAARHLAACRTATACSRKRCSLPASITRCGSTARSAPDEWMLYVQDSPAPRGGAASTAGRCLRATAR